jgi:hypothetical protein
MRWPATVSSVIPVMFVIWGGIERPRSSNHSQEPRTCIDPPGLTVIFEEADAKLDDFVAIGIDAGGLDIHDGSDELWAVIGWVVFGLWLQPTGDTILAALDERSGHLFERVLHTADMAKSKIAFN